VAAHRHDPDLALRSGRWIRCAQTTCGCLFVLCPACDRGNLYCSQACARQARAISLRQVRDRYQRTGAGRLTHAARQARYRARKRAATVDQALPSPSPTTVKSEPPGPDADASRLPGAPQPAPTGLGACVRCAQPVRFLRYRYRRYSRRAGRQLPGPFRTAAG
jgi:hypothetical protein